MNLNIRVRPSDSLITTRKLLTLLKSRKYYLEFKMTGPLEDERAVMFGVVNGPRLLFCIGVDHRKLAFHKTGGSFKRDFTHDAKLEYDKFLDDVSATIESNEVIMTAVEEFIYPESTREKTPIHLPKVELSFRWLR